MALQMSYEMANGLSGNYWKINKISMDRVANIASVVICLYKDQSARGSGKDIMLAQTYELKGSDYDDFEAAAQDAENANPVKTAYDKLKEDSFFSGASDI